MRVERIEDDGGEPAESGSKATLNGHLGADQKMYFGWRLSYRLEEPEKTPASKFRKRLQRKLHAFAGFAHREAGRERSFEASADASTATGDDPCSSDDSDGKFDYDDA